MPTLGSNGGADIIAYQRHMDGTAWGENATGHVSCFHGPQECRGNQLQLCAQNMTTDVNVWLNYTTCINGPCEGPDGHYCEYNLQVRCRWVGAVL